MLKEINSNLLCRRAARLSKTEADIRKARKLLAEAQKLAPEDVRPLLASSRMAFSDDKSREALDLVHKAEKIDPDHPAVLLQKGEILFHTRKYLEAQQAFEKILSADKQNVLAKNFLAFCHLEQGRTEEFQRRLANEGLWHRPDLVRLAWTQQKIPVIQAHEQHLADNTRPASTSLPDKEASERQRIKFARKALQKKDPLSAYQALEPIADKMKNKQNFLELFAEVSIAAGRAEKARSLLALQLKSKKKPADAYFYYLLGRCYYTEKDYPAAVDAYEKGKPYTTMPYYTAMLDYYIAMAELAAGRLKEAGQAIESACRQDSLLASIIAYSLTRLFCKGEALRDVIDEE
jgi:tetratricopeptide (TPR) repeat protein